MVSFSHCKIAPVTNEKPSVIVTTEDFYTYIYLNIKYKTTAKIIVPLVISVLISDCFTFISLSYLFTLIITCPSPFYIDSKLF